MAQTLSDMRANLDEKKVKAAHLLVENSFKPKKEQRTLDDIAKEVGVHRATLYEWRKQDVSFAKYKAALSELELADSRDLADSQLISLIRGNSNNGVASIKALQLFYEITGVKVAKHEIVAKDDRDKPHLTQEQIDTELEEMTDNLKRIK